MRIFITGGTGLVGISLIPSLIAQGYEVTVLSRNIDSAKQKLGEAVKYCASLDSIESLDDYDAVINLAGESIAGKRWTEKQKKILEESRWKITEKLSNLIKAGKNPPSVYISGSAVGYYGVQADNVITESTIPHDEFTHRLCKKWEDYTFAAKSDRTRVCILRTAPILAIRGGVLPQLLLPFKFGLGAVMGKGKQYFSWIHITDMVDIICFLLVSPNAEGIFNAAAPNPVTNKEFSKILAKTLHRPCLFRIPGSIISLLMCEISVLLLGSQRVMPQRLLEKGYNFKFSDIGDALENILQKK